MNIAMWSGPRNLSTAMMYSFAARPDFAVMDEPFYAPYLGADRVGSPDGGSDCMAHEIDPDRWLKACAEPGAPHRYMKHMPITCWLGFQWIGLRIA